jgi:hypothetical protein
MNVTIKNSNNNIAYNYWYKLLNNVMYLSIIFKTHTHTPTHLDKSVIAYCKQSVLITFITKNKLAERHWQLAYRQTSRQSY